MTVFSFLILCNFSACLYHNGNETSNNSNMNRSPRSIAIPIKLGEVLLGLFAAKNVSKGVIYSIAKAVGLIAEGADLNTEKMNEILRQYEHQNNLSSERNQLLKRQTEVIEEGFKKVTKAIQDSTRVLVDTSNERQYKEVLILIEKYFKKSFKNAKQRVKKLWAFCPATTVTQKAQYTSNTKETQQQQHDTTKGSASLTHRIPTTRRDVRSTVHPPRHAS